MVKVKSLKSNAVVRAAGGVVVRADGDSASREVLLVHRPKYDDWTLPKGKVELGERDDETALREVLEETGLECRLGAEAGTTSYNDSQDRPKVVRYWLMEPKSIPEEFVPNREVDAIRWCTVDEARATLSYAHDRKLLKAIRSSTEP
jgi:8-oxo-dGTP pyrophosphatase MutT (NUDIX family)